MKLRVLTACVLLSTLVLLSLSTTVQATEYREIKAEEILKSIESGNDIYIENVRIIGELNLSKLNIETIPNPKYNNLDIYSKYLSLYPEDDFKRIRINKELKVIGAKVIIQNSIFEDNLNFSNVFFNNSFSAKNVTFNSPADFSWTYFNSSADFSRVYFNSSADFSGANFNSFADFKMVTFNSYANFFETNFYNVVSFYSVNFNNYAHFFNTYFFNNVEFSQAYFNSFADFSWADFRSSADFSEVNFNSPASFFKTDFYYIISFYSVSFNNIVSFKETIFNNAANFEQVTFYSTAYFDDVDFNNSVDFYLDFDYVKPAENIVPTNEKTCQKIMESVKDKGKYEDADIIYYNYRKIRQDRKEWKEPSKLSDIFVGFICGYGVKPWYPFRFGIIIILVFSYCYERGPMISVDRSKKIPIYYYHRGPGICRLKERKNKGLGVRRSSQGSMSQNEAVNFFDALYFSVNTFTTVGHANWYPKENFRKLVTLEGLLGWITLGIFMATLTNVMIRV